MNKETMTTKERMEAAVKLEPLDRIPCAPLMDIYFPVKYKGMKIAECYGDMRKGFHAILDVFDEVGGWDGMILPGYSLAVTPHVYSGVVIGKTLIPGKDLGENEAAQFHETEVLTREDYDEIAKLGFNRFREKYRQRYSPYNESQILKWTQRQMEQYQYELAAWNARGLRSLCGAVVSSPMMILSTTRTLVEFTMDLVEIPDQVEAAMQGMVDDLIEDTIEAVQMSGEPGIMLVMERSGCFYYSLDIYERFEFPFMKKMIEAFAEKEIITVMHLDQDYAMNLPYFKDLPSKMVVVELDSMTDIFKAKEILKGHMCIAGDVPAALTTLGTVAEVEAYCRKLIDGVGKDGGFILSTGCTCPVECKMENLKAMVNTAKTYYPH